MTPWLMGLLVLAFPITAPSEPSARTDCYGDPLPAEASVRLGTIRLRPGDGVGTLVYSPNGRLLASTTLMQGRVCLWDTATGRPLHWLRASGYIGCLAFSPDGELLAGAGRDSAVWLWRVRTGKLIRKLYELGVVNGPLAFSADSRTLIVLNITTGQVRLWDTRSGTEFHVYPMLPQFPVPNDGRPHGFHGGARNLCFSSDHHLLAMEDACGNVTVRDVATGREVGAWQEHASWDQGRTFSPDGKLLVLAGPKGCCFWNIARGSVVRRFSWHQECVSGLTYLPDGRRLLAWSESGIHIWDATSGRELHRLTNLGPLRALAIAPDGRSIATNQNMAIRIRDLATGKDRFADHGHTTGLFTHGIAFSPDGRRLVSAGAIFLRLWDTTSGHEIWHRRISTDQYARAVAFAPDGKSLACTDSAGDVQLRDASTGRLLHTIHTNQSMISTLVFSVDSKTLFSSGLDTTIHAWDTATGREVRQLSGHTNSITSLALSPDGRRLASASDDQTIRLWDPATGKAIQTLRFDVKAMGSVAFSADGRLLACSGKRIQLWQMSAGRAVRLLGDRGPGAGPVAFLAGGRILASALMDSGQIALQNVATGQALPPLTGHRGRVFTVIVSPDGQKMASAGNDTSILIWDVEKLCRSRIRP